MPGDTLPPHAVEADDRAAWRRWLSKHHTQANGVWLVMARKGSDYASPSPDEAIEEALCFGWIDSKSGRLDERRSLLWFAPRKPKSAWSGPTQRRVEALEAAGLMHPSGQAKVDEARRSGLWHRP
ncbi:YdeI/OmpD-associated family protein [Methylibium sp.]|uniref:YdeI/OmpD-associated family protein n=1 Tax=Methylibium sp. TaxID=2067992 RepID=UPI003D141E79